MKHLTVRFDALPRWRRQSIRLRESGYAYMMAFFMVVVVLASSMAVLRNVATDGRRDREQEAIWRGNQWVRAVRMYYKKTGHYPRTDDDLKTGVPGLHFLRLAAYKDPMKTDGSWRFIYTNGAGQLIGSVRYATLQQMAVMDLRITGPATATSAPSIPQTALIEGDNDNSAGSDGAGGDQDNASSSSATTSSEGGTQSLQQANGTNSAPQPPTPPASPSQGTSATMTYSGFLSAVLSGGPGAAQGANAVAALQPTGAVDGPVIGGFLTGVGSTVDQPSVRIYHGGKKYKEWEFIWNPVEDQAERLRLGLGNPPAVPPGQPEQTPTEQNENTPPGTSPEAPPATQ